MNDLTEEFVAATVTQIQQRGGEAWGIVGDVSRSRDAEQMITATVERFGQIDILVNNAALGGLVPSIERLPDDIWHRQAAVDLSGPFFMSRAALKHMVPRRFGRIVNIGSLAGIRTGFVSGAPYTTAKSGLIGLTRQMAIEFAAYGITVNVLLPTGIRNPAILRRRPDLSRALTDNSARSIPRRRSVSWSPSWHDATSASSPEQPFRWIADWEVRSETSSSTHGGVARVSAEAF